MVHSTRSLERDKIQALKEYKQKFDKFIFSSNFAKKYTRWWIGTIPVDTGRKLNVQKTFRRRPGRLLNVLCTFNLRPVSIGIALFYNDFRFSNPMKTLTTLIYLLLVGVQFSKGKLKWVVLNSFMWHITETIGSLIWSEKFMW